MDVGEDGCPETTCDYPCVEDCTSCPGGLCENCLCVPDPCSVTIKGITFQNDHTMYDEADPCDSSGKCWGSGAALSGVDWKNVDNPDHPVAYTRGTSMRLVVRLEVTGGVGR